MTTPTPPHQGVGSGDALDWLHEQGKRRARRAPRFDVEKILNVVRTARDADAFARRRNPLAAATPRPEAHAATNFWDALDPATRRDLLSRADRRTFAAGARLMHEGERSNHVVVILRGQVKVCVEDNGRERVIAHRGPGQLIGEPAVLQVSAHSATVITLEPVDALVMKTEDFAAFVSAHPPVLDVVQEQFYEQVGEEHSQPSPLLIGQNCTIVFTDVVAFSSPERTDEHRLIIRREMIEMISGALKDIWAQCYREDRGDGLLIAVPPDIPTVRVLEYLNALPIALKRHNSLYAAGARIRLRVALDVGPVTSDSLGVSGQVIINAARLLEAPGPEKRRRRGPCQPGDRRLRLRLPVSYQARRCPERPGRFHGSRDQHEEDLPACLDGTHRLALAHAVRRWRASSPARQLFSGNPLTQWPPRTSPMAAKTAPAGVRRWLHRPRLDLDIQRRPNLSPKSLPPWISAPASAATIGAEPEDEQ